MDLLHVALILLFVAMFVLCLIFIPDKPVDGRRVSLEGEKERRTGIDRRKLY